MSAIRVLTLTLSIVLAARETLSLSSQIVYMNDLENYCSESTCRNLNFPDQNIQIFFASSYNLPSWILRFENSKFANFPLGLFTSMRNIRGLDLGNCSIKRVSESSFRNADQLEILDLSGNQIEEITENTFSLCPTLKDLDLSGNKISKIAENSFKYLPNLNTLLLTGNQIEQLPEQLFASLELNLLSLAKNKLTHLNCKMFQNTSITNLDLSGNNIQNIDANIFQNLNATRQIDFSDNPNLKSLEVHLNCSSLYASGCGLTNLRVFGSVREFYLRDNHLTSDGLYFDCPENTEILDLRNNQLQSVEFLKEFKNLTHLNLGGNTQIGNINVDSHLPNLSMIFLNNIGMSVFPSGLLVGNKEIMNLDIRENRLRRIDSSNFDLLRNVRHLQLEGNPWICENLENILHHWKPYKDLKVEVNGENKSFNGITCSDSAKEQYQQCAEGAMKENFAELQASLDKIKEMIQVINIRLIVLENFIFKK